MKTQITITDKDGNKHTFDDIQDFKKKDVEVEPLYGRYNPGEGNHYYTFFENLGTFRITQKKEQSPSISLEKSFKTKKEANQYSEWLTLNDKILSIIEEDPWRLDWDDPDQKKWFFIFNYRHGAVCKEWFFGSIQISGVQYMSRKTADRITYEFSEDAIYFWITKKKRGD